MGVIWKKGREYVVKCVSSRTPVWSYKAKGGVSLNKKIRGRSRALSSLDGRK